MFTSLAKRNVMGLGLSVALVAGCSSGSADDESETEQASDAMRGRRHGRHGFDYRGPRPHPHPRHRRFRCDHDGGAGGTAGSGGTLGKGGAAGSGGSIGKGGSVGTGGTGGRVGGPGGTGGSGGVAGACQPIGPMLLDDFEDGDLFTPSTPQGAWFSANDETPGATQLPNPWAPTAGGADGSAFAACTSGSGFLNWGALVGVVFLSAAGENQLSCIDARALHGIRFKARGSGLVKLNAATRATTAVEFGGTCSGSACGFSPFYVIALGADWQTFDVPFAALSPGNLPFDPADMLGVHYQAFDFSFPATTPIAFDFCVDDIELY